MLAADYFQSYSVVGLLAVVGVLFVAVAFGAGRLLRPVVPTPEKLLTYECGVDPVGEGWAHTQVRYYVYAFLYVIFAVDSIFLFPWATVFAAARLRRDDARGDVHLPRLPGRGPALRMEEGRPDMDVTQPRPAEPRCRAEPVLLPEPKRLGALARLAPEPMKVVLNWGRRY